jgi:hypothetical protein
MLARQFLTGLALWTCYTSLQCHDLVALELKGQLSETLPMQKTLPKGHTSCLSPQFKYTSAIHTDLGETFARIRQQLRGKAEGDRANIYSLPESSQTPSHRQSWTVAGRTRGSA